MVGPRQLGSDVYSVGAIDWDRRLFDALVPLPDGTSYNAYLIKGKEKIALIDTVDHAMADTLLRNIEQLNVKNIDYIIANHAEQDHSGSLSLLLEAYPDAKVVTTPKCKGMLMDLFSIPEEKFMTVDDGENLSLGDKTLEFIHAPWVHWPETMFTYLKEEKIVFTCDFLGSHLATSNLFADDEQMIYEASKRYYAEIMMPFRTNITKNLGKIEHLEIKMIAPSHGPIHNNPKFIIDAYKDWSSDEVKNEVVIPYISMHESTKKMVEYLVDALMKRGLTVKQFDLSQTDIGKLAMALVDASTLVLGTPTVLSGMHPDAAYAAYLANALRPKLRFASIIGSYGWGGRMVEQFKTMVPNLKVDLLDPVVIKGSPKDEDFKALDELAEEILKKHKEKKMM